MLDNGLVLLLVGQHLTFFAMYANLGSSGLRGKGSDHSVESTMIPSGYRFLGLFQVSFEDRSPGLATPLL